MSPNWFTPPVVFSDGSILTASQLNSTINTIAAGTVAVPNGGTGQTVAVSGGVLYGASTTTTGYSALLTQYGVIYGGGAAAAPVATAAGTASQVFVGGSPPAFGTAPVAGGGTGQTTYTNGQLLIGNTTGNTLTKATLTAGAGVTITNSTGSITIAASGNPRSYLAGCGLTNGTDAVNDIDIAVGTARDSTNAADITLASALTKQLDAAWAVGTNAGGLDTGAIANATYHVWLIKRSDTGVVDALFSASASAPTMPANYDYKRRIGSIVRSGATILAFKQYGDWFAWTVATYDVNQTNPGASAVTRTLTVPTGIQVDAVFNAALADTESATVTALFTDLAVTDSAPATTTLGLGQVTLNNGGVLAGWAGAPIRLRTNTSGQVRSRLSSSGASTIIRAATQGWWDTRGRDD